MNNKPVMTYRTDGECIGYRSAHHNSIWPKLAQPLKEAIKPIAKDIASKVVRTLLQRAAFIKGYNQGFMDGKLVERCHSHPIKLESPEVLAELHYPATQERDDGQSK